MRTLSVSVFALCLALGMSGSSMANDSRVLFAGVVTPGQATNMSKMPSVVRNAACQQGLRSKLGIGELHIKSNLRLRLQSPADMPVSVTR